MLINTKRAPTLCNTFLLLTSPLFPLCLFPSLSGTLSAIIHSWVGIWASEFDPVEQGVKRPLCTDLTHFPEVLTQTWQPKGTRESRVRLQWETRQSGELEHCEKRSAFKCVGWYNTGMWSKASGIIITFTEWYPTTIVLLLRINYMRAGDEKLEMLLRHKTVQLLMFSMFLRRSLCFRIMNCRTENTEKAHVWPLVARNRI